jgi:predicted nucleic acid-binding protein
MAGVLLDTGFVIALSKPDDRHFTIARQYWQSFFGSRIPIYLSTIVVSEFSLVMEIPDGILKSCIILPFGYRDAVKSGKFDLLRGRDPAEKRDSVKDDMKIIAHASNAGVDYVITRDSGSFVKYCKAMSDQAKVSFRVIDLSDGFSESHFNQGQQDLLSDQGV